jgi:triosephosphate isomerase
MGKCAVASGTGVCYEREGKRQGQEHMMPQRRVLIAGNWKMNAGAEDGLALARTLAGAGAVAPDYDLLACPPFTLLREAGAILRPAGILLGGQNCHAAESGAFTGEISAPMLRQAGCSHVILGHSERRQFFGETDAGVREKAAAAAKAGLTAVVCVGESLEQRQSGQAEARVAAQLEASLPEGAAADGVVIAYEPIWAIGTGATATSADIASMHGFIRARLGELLGEAGAGAMRILYGGSVKPDNAAEILALADVDGVLVGGASLKAEGFLAIAAARRPA